MENQHMQSRTTERMTASFLSDTRFDQLYAPSIRNLAARHWTPLFIARKAAKFLAVEPGARILDIGSGVGKFCLAAAHYKPDALFFGVEQRRGLIYHADKAKELLELGNVKFLHGNFTELDLGRYDHFYFYNAFYENLVGTDKIDNSIHYSSELYHYYNRYLYRQLEKMPAGTRLATYHSLEDEVPPGYHVVGSEAGNLLKCWIKV
jgi:SAM-dependent methyltransferase